MLMFAVGVVEMLLLMAGDIERNPGPELKPSDLVTVLTELLEAAAEWENIGLTLGLLSSDLDAIKGPYKPHKDCLRDMLKKWLNTSRASWESLITSLRSPLVSMNTLANRLEKKYNQQAIHSLTGSSDIQNRKRKLVAEDGNERQKQKLDPQPALQASTDMEMESSDMSNNKKRKLETEGDNGMRKAICPAGPDHTVSPQSGITAVTSPHTQDPMDRYSSYLREYYLRYNLPDYDKTPTLPYEKYTHLALVLQKPVTKQEADEFTKKTIHGSIDDIAKKKTSITMEEIAPVVDGVWPKCILVEGAPGIGKTTFAWEMCRRWSKRKILHAYHLVILLKLRDKKVRDAKCVSDFFHYYDKDVQQQVVQVIEQTGGRGVLLLFEGYDELPVYLRTKDSFFMDVIKGDKLPMATVLVTSRPSASGFLYEKCRHCIKQHIEILGFTSADIQSYLKDTCGENQSLLSGIRKYLQCYPHIRTMMYIPLNAGIVVEVYRTSKENSSDIPRTKTQLYQSLVCSLLRRYLSDHPVHGKKEWSICSFEELPEDVYQQFCELARIADEGIRNNQQVIFNDLPKKFDTLGLMQCVPELYVDRGAAVSHSFPHLTIQEFMAAIHISQGPVEECIERFNTCSIEERMVKRFLSGLIELNEFSIHHQDSHQIMIDQFHWIFEAQTDYPRSKEGAKEASVEYRSSSTFDWYVLGYCIAHSDRMWKIKGDYFGQIGDDCLEGLLQGVEHERQFHSGISALVLERSRVTSEGVYHLSRLPKHMLSSLKTLSLKDNPKIGEGGCTPLVEVLPATLVHLNLSNTGVGVKDCRALNKLLTSSSALETLDISRNYLPPEAVELIFSGLQASTGVKGLDLFLSCSQFSQQNYKSLASVLRNNILRQLQLELYQYHVIWYKRSGINLKILHLNPTTVCATVSIENREFPPFFHQIAMIVYALGYCISHTNYTWEIGLCANTTTDSGVMVTLVRGILDCDTQPQSTLSSIYNAVSDSGDRTLNITFHDLTHLLQLPEHMLSSLKILSVKNVGEGVRPPPVKKLPVSLVHLNLSNTGIGVEDCQSLNKLLTSSSSLKTLTISKNYLPPEAVELIFSGLQASTGVKGLELSMSCSEFSQQNCESLASVLQSNATLRQLHCYNSFKSGMNMKILRWNPTTFRATVTLGHTDPPSHQNVTLAYVLGYCISHTNYTWEIGLCTSSDTDDRGGFMESFVQGILDCDTQPQSTISSLYNAYNRTRSLNITFNDLRHLLKMPEHMLSSLKIISKGGKALLVEKFLATLVNINLSNTGIGVEDCKALNKLLTSSSALETLDVSENYLPPEAVEMIFSGLQASTGLRGLKLSMSCSQFSQQNCKSLASVLQKNTTLRQLHCYNSFKSGMNVKILRWNPTIFRAIVTLGHTDPPSHQNVTLAYVLGYCISHTNHTWEIGLCTSADTDYRGGFMESFVRGILDCDTQPRSTISNLYGYERALNITFSHLSHLQKLPEDMLPSLIHDTQSLKIIGEGSRAPLVEMLPVTLNLSNIGIGVEDYRALNKLLTASSALQTLNISGNYLPPEAVELIFSGLQASTGVKGLKLSMACSQFSLQNCKSLASVLQNNNLSQLQLWNGFNTAPSVCGTICLYLNFLQEFSAIRGSVTQYQSDRSPGIDTLHYVLGYCLSHTSYTWEIQLGSEDFISYKGQAEIGDAEVEVFVRGVLDCEAQPQSTITSLTICHSKITSESIRQILKIPKHILSSMKTLALADSPGIDVACYTALNTLLESSPTLETLDLRGNNLSPDAVAVVLSGLQKSNALRGLNLLMSCSAQFPQQNCKSLASVLQNNNGTLRQLKLESSSTPRLKLGSGKIPNGILNHGEGLRAHLKNLYRHPKLNLKFLQEPSTSLRGSVTWYQSERVSIWHHVLGYCVSHTTYTWNIELSSMKDYCSKKFKVDKIGDAEVEEFVREVLNCEAQPQSTITSLTISHSKITSESVRQILKIPKHMLSSMKKLALTDSPGIDEVGYTALNTLLESSATLEILNLRGNNLSPESVAVVLNGVQKMNLGLKLFMTCSQFSLENCRLLASGLQHNTSILREIGISLYENNLEWYNQHRITLRILPGPLAAIQGSVRLENRAKIAPQPGCTMWDYVLGYCVSHTDHIWAIDLDGFGDEDVERFMQGILDSDSRNISSLSLSGKKLTSTGTAHLLKLPECISSLKVPLVVGGCMPLIKKFQETLVELHLGGSKIDTDDYQFLSELLSSPSTLEIMNIEGSLPPEAVKLIFNALEKNNKLKEFSMCSSQFSQENCKSLISVVQKNIGGGTLRRLQVAFLCKLDVVQEMELQFLPGPVTGVCGSVSNIIEPNMVNATLHYALGYCVSHTVCTWEITINLHNTLRNTTHALRDEEVKAFVDGVLDCEYEQQSPITSLSLLGGEASRITRREHKLTSMYVSYLLKLPKHMLSSLKTLSLKHNPTIGEGGCAPLVEMLPSTLVRLDLSNTGIGVEDCRALNKLLTSSSALETLDISGNHLPPEAVELIFSGLQGTTKLKTLKIDHSKLSPKAYELLSSVLRSHSLTLLSMTSCNIGSSETGQLVEALMYRDTLQCLILGNNPIGAEGADHFCRYMQHSKSLRRLDLSEWLGEWSPGSYRSSLLSGNTAENLTSVLRHGHNTTLETLILPDRFSAWIPESLRSRITTKQRVWQKSHPRYLDDMDWDWDSDDMDWNWDSDDIDWDRDSDDMDWGWDLYP